MPIIPGVIATFDKLKTLHRDKNTDYSGDKGSFWNFEVAEYFGSLVTGARDKVYATLLGIKFARLAILLSKRESPNFESIEDSFDDFICYSAIWKADYMERHKKNVVEINTIRETKHNA